jgi:hypothetical protein
MGGLEGWRGPKPGGSGFKKGVGFEGFWPIRTAPPPPPPEEKTKARRKRRNHKPEEEEEEGKGESKIKTKTGEAEREQGEGRAQRLKGLRRREQILRKVVKGDLGGRASARQ